MRMGRDYDFLISMEEYPNVTFYGPCSIKKNVKIGEGTRIGEFTVIGENAKIGKNCRILYHVTICKDAVIGNNAVSYTHLTLPTN